MDRTERRVRNGIKWRETEKQKESDRNGQKQTKKDRNRRKQTEKDRKWQKQMNQKDPRRRKKKKEKKKKKKCSPAHTGPCDNVYLLTQIMIVLLCFVQKQLSPIGDMRLSVSMFFFCVCQVCSTFPGLWNKVDWNLWTNTKVLKICRVRFFLNKIYLSY